MLKITTLDGELIEGSTPTEILENLKNVSPLYQDRELEEYLQNLITCLQTNHDSINTAKDHDDFFLDLLSIGYIKPLKKSIPQQVG